MVGSGIAGALAALGAAQSGPVVVITEGALGDGSTRRAQGGIAAAVNRGDSGGATCATPWRPARGCATPRRRRRSAGRGRRR